jgi:hypothetical protein
MEIDFFTCLGRNSLRYANLIKEIDGKLASSNANIKWKAIESMGCDGYPDGYEMVDKMVEDSKQSSMNHGKTLNLIKTHIEREYVIISDCDLVILYKEWDKVVEQNLRDVDLFGLSYHDGDNRYNGKPSIFFLCFKSSLFDKFGGIDFRPIVRNGKVDSKKLISKDEALLYGKKIGQIVNMETGDGILTYIRNNHLQYKCLSCVYQGSKESKLKIPMHGLHKASMAEWHYNNELFAIHRKNSRNNGISDENDILVKYIRDYLNG